MTSPPIRPVRPPSRYNPQTHDNPHRRQGLSRREGRRRLARRASPESLPVLRGKTGAFRREPFLRISGAVRSTGLDGIPISPWERLADRRAGRTQLCRGWMPAPPMRPRRRPVRRPLRTESTAMKLVKCLLPAALVGAFWTGTAGGSRERIARCSSPSRSAPRRSTTTTFPMPRRAPRPTPRPPRRWGPPVRRPTSSFPGRTS